MARHLRANISYVVASFRQWHTSARGLLHILNGSLIYDCYQSFEYELILKIQVSADKKYGNVSAYIHYKRTTR